MRLLHTSDWHLGRRLHGADLLADQAIFLEWLLGVAQSERVDAVLVSGDVYDRAQTDTLLADKADTADVYDRAQTDTLLADKADTVEVYDRTETDETFLGRDPDVIMRQATSSLVGLLGPLASSLSGTRILAGSGAVSELTGPAALIDPIGGRTDFRLNAVRYCIDDIVLGATVDRVSVSVRDELGVIRTVDDPIDRPAPGCQTIDVTSLRAGVAHYVEFDVVGIGSLNVTSMETEWGAVPDPTSST